MLDLKEKWEETFSYEIYRTMIDNLLSENKTTGTNHSEEMINYTKMNVQRMKRLDKTVKINKELATKMSAIKEQQHWLVITEAWCGDAAQILPFLAKLTEENDLIKLGLLLRDEHDSLINGYLTNGARSIPKLIVLNAAHEELGNWGPRPVPAQKIVMDNKVAKNPEPYSEIGKNLQLWYARDKTQTLQAEFLKMLENLA